MILQLCTQESRTNQLARHATLYQAGIGGRPCCSGGGPEAGGRPHGRGGVGEEWDVDLRSVTASSFEHGGATHWVPPCPVRGQLGCHGGGSETSTGETAVLCRLRETELEVVTMCGGEERQPAMTVLGAVATATTEEKATAVLGATATEMAAHRQISAT
jgi:hypothetical protein